MSEKLYYTDSHLHEFNARLLSCRKEGERYLLRLDRTAFFPEGGGQLSDTGSIGPARVLDCREQGESVIHYADRPLEEGEEYSCAIDWEQRRRRMQNHSGEHVVSGLVHRIHGLDNVGFHMGREFMSLDFNGELSRAQTDEIEYQANLAVRDNIPVRAFTPGPEELAALDYRSKKALNGQVRIVEIPGIDLCACCAPHVSATGEIGLIKILDAERHRGGTRLSLVCGMDALDNYRLRQDSAAAISALLSAKRDQIQCAVERLLAEQARLKEKLACLGMEAARRRAEATDPSRASLCLFDSVLDEPALRELVNILTENCPGLVAVFSGDDREGYRYIIGSRSLDLRAAARGINAGIEGRGGGSREMIQGRASASAETIQKFIEAYSV